MPEMPWEERPVGNRKVMWRYSGNPVVPRDLLPDSNSIFNSAIVPFGDGYAGVFRCDDTNIRMTLHAGFSKDGIHWGINPETIRFEGADPEIAKWEYGYDPRVCLIGDRYYVTWCNGYHGPSIGLAGPRTSRASTSWRTSACRSTATASSSRVRSMGNMQCCPVRATTDTHRSGTSSTPNPPTSNTGDTTAS